MELSSALLCPALPCSALLWRASCSLHPDCTKFEPATEQQDFVLFDRTLVCVFPRPSPDIGGAGAPSRGSCRLAANDPKAVQDGQATTQDPKDRASGFLSRPATGARANLASTRDYHFAGATTVSQFCWLVLRIGTDLILSSDGAGWWASQGDCLHPLAIYGKVFCFLGPHFPDTLQFSRCHWGRCCQVVSLLACPRTDLSSSASVRAASKGSIFCEAKLRTMIAHHLHGARPERAQDVSPSLLPHRASRNRTAGLLRTSSCKSEALGTDNGYFIFDRSQHEARMGFDVGHRRSPG
ncbi:uncharacterized protein K444DRAFT_630580 [Hyaloscypha bicolor E]|uniref:Secreted protein n=1 Tax=Hyaloscypha bicolor E TaxID=1095630 RepID=A0A2J6T7H9_9HELO|nr:uncharacterized protein K444DRAFT_630580 [Hyaloscypha bicolor E]PMD58923.1 hypothetical protein K444DRAFT_630580 [Hyaloscypha bicolor E]